MKNKNKVVNARHTESGPKTSSLPGFRFDLLTNETGERSLRIRNAVVGPDQPVELIVPASQAYHFMEAVIHYVATMEKSEMQTIVKGKRKATVGLSPHDH